MVICCISTCNSSHRNCKKKQISVHRFPTDIKIRKLWLNFCNISSQEDAIHTAKNSQKFICSLHFDENCFQRDLQAELMSETRRPRLKPNAVPSINIEKESKKLKAQNAKAESGNAGNGCIKIENEFEEYTFQITEVDEQVASDEMKLRDEILILQSKLHQTQQENERLKTNNLQNCKEIQNIQLLLTKKSQENEIATQQLCIAEVKYQKLEQHFTELKNQRVLDFQQLKRNITVDDVKKMIGTVLTPNQIDLILDRKKQVRWTEDELRLASTILCLSKQCYEFIRCEMQIPLPSVSTLERYAAKS